MPTESTTSPETETLPETPYLPLNCLGKKGFKVTGDMNLIIDDSFVEICGQGFQGCFFTRMSNSYARRFAKTILAHTDRRLTP